MRTAITGGIAEGKSTVLTLVAEVGLQVDSADSIAREVFQDASTQQKLAFLLNVDGAVEPGMLRAAMQVDSQIRRSVNGITHPKILRRMLASSAAYIEVPLLFEACLQSHFDRVWVVTCGPEEQLRRLTERLGNEADAQQMINTQLPSRVKIPFADLVIRTNEAHEAVRRFVSLAVNG